MSLIFGCKGVNHNSECSPVWYDVLSGSWLPNFHLLSHMCPFGNPVRIWADYMGYPKRPLSSNFPILMQNLKMHVWWDVALLNGKKKKKIKKSRKQIKRKASDHEVYQVKNVFQFLLIFALNQNQSNCASRDKVPSQRD